MAPLPHGCPAAGDAADVSTRRCGEPCARRSALVVRHTSIRPRSARPPTSAKEIVKIEGVQQPRTSPPLRRDRPRRGPQHRRAGQAVSRAYRRSRASPGPHLPGGPPLAPLTSRGRPVRSGSALCDGPRPATVLTGKPAQGLEGCADTPSWTNQTRRRAALGQPCRGAMSAGHAASPRRPGDPAEASDRWAPRRAGGGVIPAPTISPGPCLMGANGALAADAIAPQTPPRVTERRAVDAFTRPLG